MRPKVFNIDEMFNEVKIKIIEQAKEATKETIEQLTKENDDLKDINKKLLKAAKRADSAQENFNLMNFLVSKLKSNLEKVDGEEKAKLVYDFLDCFFEKDFLESTYEVPLWLGCVTQYYYNKETIIEILRLLDFYIPSEIENFRLPIDWTEEELDVFFDNMGNHVVCNSCYFEDNLRFWKPNALKNPTEVCKEHFSEVPWQYILRNPLIRKEKYLIKISEMFCSNSYHSDQWLNFTKITEYQELTEGELRMLINNIKYAFYNNKNDDLRRLLLAHIHLIDDEAFLTILYDYNKDSYDFKYTNTVLKMPYKFIKQYMTDNKAFEWLNKHKDNFTKDQIKELTLAALEE